MTIYDISTTEDDFKGHRLIRCSEFSFMPATPERACDRRSRTDHRTQMQEYFFDRGLRIEVGQAWVG